MMKESGAAIIRMDFTWDSTERQKGVYDFSAYERLTDSLEKHNIRPLYILDYGNRLYDQGLSPYSGEGRQAFARWAAAAAVHFKDRSILWEMWNEPNLTQFWKPKTNPDDYIKLALEVGQALREAAPDELYIGPAASDIDFDFLEKCFKAGLLEYWDAVSVHPYRQREPETVIPDYAKLRWMIDKYAPEGKQIPILSAEWGYSSAWANYNDEIQGKMLPRQWMINLACEIPVSIWYDWHDDGTDPKEPEHHFGTVNYEYHRDRTPVYDPKPAYLAAKTFTEVFQGFQYNKRLVMAGVPNVYVFLFSNEDKDVRLAVWTTEKEPQKITIPCSHGSFKAISYLGEELRDLLTVHGHEMGGDRNILPITVTDEPIYLIPLATNEALSSVAEWKSEPLAIYRSNVSRTAKSTIIVSSFPHGKQDFTQNTVAFPVAPLIVRTPMIEGNELVIQIDNPTGQQFRGSIHPKVSSGITLSPLYTQPKQMLIQEGKQYHVERFRIVQRQGDCYTVSVDLYDYGSRNLRNFRETALPLQKVCPHDDFSQYDTATLNAAWGIFPDGDAKVGSEQSIEVAENGTVKLTYKFDAGWKFLRLAPKEAALRKIEGAPKELTFRVEGDGSGNSVRLRFVDARGQTFQVNGGTMPEKKSYYFSFPLDGEGAGHWGGPNDGKIEYPISFDSIIIDGLSSPSDRNTIEISSPVLVY